MTRDELRASQREAEGRLRMVLVPTEWRGLLRTTDRTEYRRQLDGSIRRVHPKVRGKKAREADKRARGRARADA